MTIMGEAQELGMRLAAEKLESVSASGADALVLACPSCCMAYENSQRMIGRMTGKDHNLPDLYFTQVLGSTLVMTEQQLGFSFDRIPFRSASNQQTT